MLKMNNILGKNDNNRCADCKSEFISHVNTCLYVILCDKCALVHRLTIPSSSNDIKSLTHDQWRDGSDVTSLELINNSASNDDLLKAVPIHYSPLTYDSVLIWRKYFIFAKYVDKKFTYNGIFQSNGPKRLVKEGILWKRSKNNFRYKERYFLLQENKSLVYFQDTKISNEPKRVIPIDKLDLYLVPEKMEMDNGLQLSFSENNSIRDIYVYSAKPFDILEWYNLIRAAKLELLKINYPDEDTKTLLKLVSGNIIKEGYMDKSGKKTTDFLRKRWFSLIENSYFLCTVWSLRYYKNPLDSEPRGKIHIGKNSDGYRIDLTRTFTGRKIDDRTFTLVTKARSYDLIADTHEEKERWIRYLNMALFRDS